MWWWWLAFAALMCWPRPGIGLVYYFTARDFMPAGCTPNIKSLWPEQDDWLWSTLRCPIRGEIAMGRASGHPDFELNSGVYGQGCSGNAQSLNMDRTKPNLTSYAGGVSCVSTTSNQIGSLTKMVEPWLEFHEDGIPKPVYCANGKQQQRCGWAAGNKPATSSKFHFDRWYRDDAAFNKRVSFALDLKEIGAGVFSYASAQFNPLDGVRACAVHLENQTLDCSNGGKVWPRGHLGAFNRPYDENARNTTFGFTTEMHTFFTFAGTETFEFSGDDDVWVYLNERLALDVGGLHTPARSVINLGHPIVQQRLGLVPGQVYAIDVFHAERKSLGSNFGITTSLQAECGILTSARSTMKEDGMDWTLVGATWTSAPNLLRLITAVQTSMSTYAFVNTRKHIGPGFVAKFRFTAKGSATSGGFAFVILHTNSLEDALNGGSGLNMGFRKNFPQALAVAFEAFGGKSVALVARGNTTLASAQLMSANAMNDGKEHAVEIRYYGQRPAWMEVYLDGGLFLQKRDLRLDAFELLNSTSAFVGFTAGSDHEHKTDVSIREFDFFQVEVDATRTRLIQDDATSVVGGVADGRSPIRLQVQTFDACGNAIHYGGLKDKLVARLEPIASLRRLLTAARSTVHDGQVTDAGNGLYEIIFTSTTVGDYHLFAEFDTITFANRTLLVRFVPPPATFAPTWEASQQEEEEGLSQQAVAALAGSLLAFCLVCTPLLILGVRYRDEWRATKKFIPAGKQAEAERDVEYYAGGEELDALRVKVEESLHAINFERSKHVSNKRGAAQLRLLDEISQLQQAIAHLRERKAMHLNPL